MDFFFRLYRILLAGIFLLTASLTYAQNEEAVEALQEDQSQAEKLDVGFNVEWENPDVDVYLYDEIYINIIDLRDMNIRVIDEDGDEFIEDMDEETLEQMGYLIFSRFADKLDKVIPVNRDDIDTKLSTNKPSLLLDIKISGDFSLERQRILMQWLTNVTGANAQAEPGKLMFESRISDLETGEELVVFGDTQEFVCDDPYHPFASANDMRWFVNLMNIWSQRVANILITKKEERVIPSRYKALLDSFSSQ